MAMVFRILAPIPEIGGERGDRLVVYGAADGAYLVRAHRHPRACLIPFRQAVPIIFSAAVCPPPPPDAAVGLPDALPLRRRGAHARRPT